MSLKVKWYPFLKDSDNESKDSGKRALLKFESPTSDSFIVCQEITNRYFAMFTTYLEFARYFLKEVNQTHQCFFEVIFGNRPQKPYFDIDMRLGDDSPFTFEDGQTLKRQLVASILKEYPEIKASDIMIFSSHSSTKFSLHIIVDKWCVLGYKENEKFCEKIIANVDAKLTPCVDSKVYKSIQQLRIYGSHKWETTRTKVFDSECTWTPPETPANPGHEFIIVLTGSLIGIVGHCQIITGLTPVDLKPKFTGEGWNLNEEDVNSSLTFCAKMEKVSSYKDRSFPFEFHETQGGMIILKRLRPSMCLLCQRTHENENPYLTVVGKGRDVYFHCRRNEDNAKLYIGSLGSVGVEELSGETFSDVPSLDSVMEKIVYLHVAQEEVPSLSSVMAVTGGFPMASVSERESQLNILRTFSTSRAREAVKPNEKITKEMSAQLGSNLASIIGFSIYK